MPKPEHPQIVLSKCLAVLNVLSTWERIARSDDGPDDKHWRDWAQTQINELVPYFNAFGLSYGELSNVPSIQHRRAYHWICKSRLAVLNLMASQLKRAITLDLDDYFAVQIEPQHVPECPSEKPLEPPASAPKSKNTCPAENDDRQAADDNATPRSGVVRSTQK